MNELTARMDELVLLMREFGLEKARLSGDGWLVEFAYAEAINFESVTSPSLGQNPDREKASPRTVKQPAAQGTPIASPMTGIFYAAPSPSAPPFVKEGETVVAGQVIGLIEAMKVFSEIPATTSGVVSKIIATSGQLVQPGDPLLYIQ